jgi:hypothetical protein
MKVKIGPYVDYFGPHQLAELLCFWAKKRPDEDGILRKPDWVYNFGEWLAHGSVKPDKKVGDIIDWNEDRTETWLYKLLKWIDKKKKRNIYVRIDHWDTWSMDDTLAHIILPMLKKLQATKHGAPFVDDEDVPEHLRSTAAPPKENDYDTDDNHHLRWDWVLDEMIHSFETKVGVLKDWEDQFTTGDYHFQFKKISEDGTSEMIEGPNHTAVTDWDGMKAYQNRISNGFRLFGKYYQSLWS